MRARLRHPTPPDPSAAWCRLYSRGRQPTPGGNPSTRAGRGPPPRPASRGRPVIRPWPATPSPAMRPASTCSGGAGCRLSRSLTATSIVDSPPGHHHAGTNRAPTTSRERLGQPKPALSTTMCLHLQVPSAQKSSLSCKPDTRFWDRHFGANQAHSPMKDGKLTVQPEPSQSVLHHDSFPDQRRRALGSF